MNNVFNPEEFEEAKPTIVGHLLIRDADTGEILVNQRGTVAQQVQLEESSHADQGE
jgi:hypothetical protein